jgi:hypothetical protein
MQSYYYSSEKAGSFFRKLVFILVFFTLTPIALVSSTISLISLTNTESKNTYVPRIVHKQTTGVQVYASLPSDFPSVSGEIVEEDARPEIIKGFLTSYRSPLTPYSNFIVETADKYGIDWKLITAIAMKESGVCKIIPDESYNCWGWGIHSAGTLRFDSYEEGIEIVSKGIREYYVDIGLVTIEEIMSKWIPHSPNGAWAEGVRLYMAEMN